MAEREDILKKIKGANLVMSSVPSKTREEFVEFAEKEFADNYGACLKYIWDYFKIFSTFFQAFDAKLDNITNLIKNGTPEEKETIRTLSGRLMKGGSKKDE